MKGDLHVRFCERLGVKFPRSTRPKYNITDKVPQVEFTHRLGRCNDISGTINDQFEIEYLNATKPSHHYMIRIAPSENKVDFKNKRGVIRSYVLKDGAEALYLRSPGGGYFKLLVFEKDDWQYILSIDDRIKNKVSAEELVRIAESIVLVYPPLKNPLD